MGILRTLFAISVVFIHATGYISISGRNNTAMLIGGQLAVQLFYMISGFLISYILVERKAYPTVGAFYINRYLRLYPLYLAVAVLSLLSIIASSVVGRNPLLFNVYRDAPLAAVILLTFSNLTIFLQDWILFLAVKAGELTLSANFKDSDVPLYRGLLIPQAWTLGVELCFYMIAPFILPRRRVLLALLGTSVIIRLFLFWIDLGSDDPWTYRFFPAELALFLVGALAHQELLPLYRRFLSTERLRQYSKYTVQILVTATLGYCLVPMPESIKMGVFLLAFMALLPLTFIFNQTNELDKKIGDLSFPVYICHILVINSLNLALKKLPQIDPIAFGFLATLTSVIFAYALNKLISAPVEKLRTRIKHKSTSA